jgi:hypothetical protein
MGSLVVALVSWIWSVLFYVVSPVPYYTVSQTGNDRAAGQALLEHFPVSGTYILPDRKTDRETRLEMRSHGPVATIYLKREGAPFSSPWKVIVGTLQGLAIGFLLGLGLRWLARIEPDVRSRIGIAAIFGLSYTIYPRVADIIWSDFPPGYQWMMIFSDGVSWLLMATVMAWFTRPLARTAPNQAIAG